MDLMVFHLPFQATPHYLSALIELSADVHPEPLWLCSCKKNRFGKRELLLPTFKKTNNNTHVVIFQMLVFVN